MKGSLRMAERSPEKRGKILGKQRKSPSSKGEMSKENGKDVQEGKKDLVERRKSPKIKREWYLQRGEKCLRTKEESFNENWGENQRRQKQSHKENVRKVL